MIGKRQGPPVPAEVPPLKQAEKDLMMAGLIRLPRVVRAAVNRVRPEHFLRDPVYEVLWKTILDFWEENRKLPSHSILRSALQSAEFPSSELDLDERDHLQEGLVLLKSAFMLSKEELESNERWTLQLLKRYLTEAHREKLQATLGRQGVPEDMPMMLQQFVSEAREYTGLHAEPVGVPFPDNQELYSPVIRSTGVSFLDMFLGGGHADGESHLLMGTIGGGKTTLSLQLLSESAKFAWSEGEPGRRSQTAPLSYYFFYEGHQAEMQARILSCHAKISRTFLESFQGPYDLEQFSSSAKGNYKPYELAMMERDQAAGLKFFGELERFKAARHMLNSTVRLVDMTGADPKYPGRGRGGVEEIASILDNEQRMFPERRVRFVAIDYVGLIAQRRMLYGSGSLRPENLRHYLAAIPPQVNELICGPYKCPVWMVQQLSTNVLNKGSAYVPHHRDASECRALAAAVNFSFQIGSPNDDNVCAFSCTKHRRQPPNQHAVVQILGDLSRVESTDRFVTDPVTGRIISRDEHDQLNSSRPKTQSTRPKFNVI